MEFKNLGNTKERIPEIGIGTWKMVGNEDRDIKAIRLAVDNGMNLIDTAEMYGNESMVGRAIEGMGDKVLVATKVSPHNFRYEDVIAACDRSRKKLGMESIDLYQLHWPNHSIPIQETMRAMEHLQREGKIRHIGISNFDVRETNDAQASLKNAEIVSNQVEYSILVRDVEKELLDHCKRNRITVIAYSPLARGALFEKRYKKLGELLSSMGKAHGKTASQVALNWLIAKEPVVAIPKASERGHVEENAGASGWKLSAAEAARVNDFLPV